MITMDYCIYCQITIIIIILIISIAMDDKPSRDGPPDPCKTCHPKDCTCSQPALQQNTGISQ